ncbi:hypothetical protein [Bradyrhizobium cenepequi]
MGLIWITTKSFIKISQSANPLGPFGVNCPTLMIIVSAGLFIMLVAPRYHAIARSNIVVRIALIRILRAPAKSRPREQMPSCKLGAGTSFPRDSRFHAEIN